MVFCARSQITQTNTDACCASPATYTSTDPNPFLHFDIWQQAGYDVVTLDTAAGRVAVKATLAGEASGGKHATLQGNLSPLLLVPREGVSMEAQKVMSMRIFCVLQPFRTML